MVIINTNLFVFLVPLELTIFSKEHFNQWYSLSSYYLSYTVVDLPIQVIDIKII